MSRRIPPPPIEITSLIECHADGAIHDTLNHDLRTVARAVQKHGGKGQITLTIDVASGGDRKLLLTLAAKSKVPRPKQAAREVFLHEDGSLHGHHPEQKLVAFDEADVSNKKPTADM